MYGVLRLLRSGPNYVVRIPSQDAGDLYVIPTIALPNAETDLQKAAYQNFEKAFDFKPRTHLKG